MSNDAYGIKGRLRIEENSTASNAKGELRIDSSGNLLLHNGSSEAALVRTDQLDSLVYDNSTSGLTAADPQNAIDEVEARLEVVEGDLPTGDVVGTSDTQTLTNKTIDADNNTITNLVHGAEVDNPTSNVHGVTGDVVGTTDTQTLSNKTLTSPVLNTSISGTAVLDEDNMASDSDTQLATQQSIKAYADTKIAQNIVDAKGDIIVATADNTVTRLAVGSNDQVLTADSGEASGLKWAAVPTGDLAVNNYTTTQTLTTSNQFVTADASSAAFTITLYAASGNTGKQLTIKKTDSTFNIVTIDANASETIDGATTLKLCTQNDQVTIVCDGTNWQVVSRSWNSGWNTYTPTVVGAGTPSFNAFKWRRSGINVLDIQGRFDSGTVSGSQATVSLPTGLSAVSGGSAREYVGTYSVSGANTNQNKMGTVLIDNTNTVLKFGRSNYAVAVDAFGAVNGNDIWTTGESVGIQATVHVSEWS